MKVYRYAGHYEGGGTPPALWDFTVSDEEYEDSLVHGHKVQEEDGPVEEDDMPPSHADDGLAALQADEGRPTPPPSPPTNSTPAPPPSPPTNSTPEYWHRNCWPHNCAKPWMVIGKNALEPGQIYSDRKPYPPGSVYNDGNWQEYIEIPYQFDTGVDDVRKEAFKEAADRWRQQTCINLVQKLSLDFSQGPGGLLVGVSDPDKCSATGRGQGGKVEINLGWCNSMVKVGNIMHEIGHALGMDHEQKRVDATANLEGHGPYLTMHWENIDESVERQFEQDKEVYIGSANDGEQDPRVGYAPYDFGSIMHYPSNGRFDTNPITEMDKVGNRQHLTQGDIEEVHDIYQCKKITTPQPEIIDHVVDPSWKLGLCEGDCDTDENCQSGLECFQREGYTSVPGCVGGGSEKWDYCYNSTNPRLPELTHVDGTFGNHITQKLGPCTGDCDSDSECQEGYACFQRGDQTPVPGCYGKGTKDWDFCYEPVLNDLGLDPDTTDGLGRCSGDCDTNSDCAGDLECFERDALESVPGCTGQGAEEWDYCYQPDLNDLGLDPDTPDGLGRCSGDCDTNSDCADGLACFQREALESVPGCTGQGKNAWDYCYGDPHSNPK